MRRLIDPVTFGQAIQAAQYIRSQGESQIAAAKHACDEVGIHPDWTAPLIGFLNDSPSAAEAWARRVYNEALDRAVTRMEANDVTR